MECNLEEGLALGEGNNTVRPQGRRGGPGATWEPHLPSPMVPSTQSRVSGIEFKLVEYKLFLKQEKEWKFKYHKTVGKCMIKTVLKLI